MSALRNLFGRLGVSVQGHRALDFGCGVGRITQALCPYFDHVVGVDVAPTMIERARKANRFPTCAEYVVNDRSDLSRFPDAHFDFLYCFLVLQHVGAELARSYIAEFVRVLRPGGVGAFQIPAEPAQGVRDARAGAGHLDERLFSARYSPVDAPATAVAGSFVRVAVDVVNTSSVPWYPASERRGWVRLGAMWLDADSGELVVEELDRVEVSDEVPPSRSAVLELVALAPSRPGRYLLKVGLVCEFVAHFEEHGVTPLLIPIEIVEGKPQGKRTGRLGTVEQQAPSMIMEALRRDEVEGILETNGARVLDVRADTLAGDGWESFTYLFVRA